MAPTHTVPVEHRDEANFHAAFRADLLSLTDEAVLLSPFLHSGRACQYYALFGDLVRRGARIVLYTKPERELAGDAREEHARVTNSLRAVGVDLHPRPGMHEKVAAIDRTILWHGSLNILSHGSSSESMLRMVSTDLVAEMLADLKIDEAPRRDTGACGSVENGHEEARGADAGMPGQESAAGLAAVVRDADLHCLCPRCETPMTVRRGAWTLVACPAAGCGFAFDARLSRWMLGSRGRGRPA